MVAIKQVYVKLTSARNSLQTLILSMHRLCRSYAQVYTQTRQRAADRELRQVGIAAIESGVNRGAQTTQGIDDALIPGVHNNVPHR